MEDLRRITAMICSGHMDTFVDGCANDISMVNNYVAIAKCIINATEPPPKDKIQCDKCDDTGWKKGIMLMTNPPQPIPCDCHMGHFRRDFKK